MATDTKPVTGLSDAEQRQLDKLLAKANAGNVHAPAVRVGEPYVALINLSLPRRGQVLRPGDVPQCDLVPAGETVWLTEDEVARFNRHDPNKDGRKIEVVRKLGERDDLPVGRVHPSLLSGPIMRPPAPQPGQNPEIPRPDPPGASRIIEQNPLVPETMPVQPGSENGYGDALDIAPGGAGSAQASMAGVDMDLVNAAKAAMGTGRKG